MTTLMGRWWGGFDFDFPRKQMRLLGTGISLGKDNWEPTSVVIN
jgi:hypothetical protein